MFCLKKSILLLGVATSALAAEEYYNILAMDGGGIRGLVTAQVIKHMENYGYEYALGKGYIEKRAGKKINMSELFDMMAGTSTGSLLTTALTMPDKDGANLFTSEDVIDIYRDKGAIVFSKFSLSEDWKWVWGVIVMLILGGLGYLDGRNRYSNENQEKTFNDFEKFLSNKKEKASIAENKKEASNYPELEKKESISAKMSLNFDVKKMMARATVVAHNEKLEKEIQSGSLEGVLEAEDALEEMRETYESDKKKKWIFVVLGGVIGLLLGYFGSGLIYQATHSLNDRKGIESICKSMFGSVPIVDALTDEIFIVSFDYSEGNPIFFTKLYAENPEIKNDKELYGTTLSNAAEASAAAPIYFDPKIMGTHILIDGGVIANNPSLYAYEYANKVLDKKLIRIVSIGTAIGPGKKLDADTVNLLDWALEISSLITTPEQKTHSWVAKYFGKHNVDFDYNRFNYNANKSLSLDMIKTDDLNEFQWMGDQIYFEKEATFKKLVEEMIEQKLAP